MINNLQNIASVGATQGEGAKASQAVAVQFPNISEQNQKSSPHDINEQVKEGVAELSELQNAVEELNEKVARQELKVNFTVDKETGRFIVKVMDSKTGHLIRQIPNEETLQFTRSVERGLGAIVDEHL